MSEKGGGSDAEMDLHPQFLQDFEFTHIAAITCVTEFREIAQIAKCVVIVCTTLGGLVYPLAFWRGDGGPVIPSCSWIFTIL